MTKPAVSNFRDKWNAIEPQKRRYILFAGLIIVKCSSLANLHGFLFS